MLAAGVVVGALAMATVVNTPAARMAGFQFQPAQVRQIADLSSEDLTTLRALDESFANLAAYIEPATVLIKSEGSGRQADVLGRRMPEMGGSGSGVIFRPDGWIITNDHVVGGFEKVTVVLNDGREYAGKVTRAEDSDIALVKVEAKDLPTVQFADSSKVRPGQFAIAVGSPFGLENSVTVGHVSALGRRTSVPDARLGVPRVYADLIQTDASINMGNSGGPLLNIEGQVIGINTAIFSGTGGSVGIGFAIPSNQARLIAETLITKGKVTRSYMGVLPETIKEYRRKELGIEGGAVVADIPSDGPAAIAGLKKDDVVIRVGEAPVRNEQELRNAMLRYAPGQTVDVEYLRGKERRTAEVRLGTPPVRTAPQRPQNAPQRGDEEMPDIFKRFDFPDLDFRMPNPGQRNDRDVAPLREGQARLGIGVESVTPTLRKQFSIPADVQGAVITQVDPGSVAESNGLKVGDVVLQLGDKKIASQADLREAMSGVKWGDAKNLKTARYGEGSTFVQERTIRFK